MRGVATGPRQEEKKISGNGFVPFFRPTPGAPFGAYVSAARLIVFQRRHHGRGSRVQKAVSRWLA